MIGLLTEAPCEMAKITTNREVYVHNLGVKFRRKLYAHGSDHMKYIINRLTVKGKGMKIGVCSNLIDFRALKPPMLKDMMTPDWRLWTNAVYKKQIGNPDIYLKKNLIWDIDAEGEPMVAFRQGEKVCEYLVSQGYEPMMVFSGSKGFHVWLNEKDSKRMVGQQFSDFKSDNAKFLAKAYCEVVKDVFVKATEEEFRGADLTPVEEARNYCLSIFGSLENGTDCLAMDENDLKAVRALPADALPIDIAKAIHEQENGQLWNTDVHFTENPMYFTPCHKVFNRGMPVWKGIDG